MALPALPRMRGRFVDYSGTITQGGTAQPQVPPNANRNYLLIQNNHATADLWVQFGMAATTSWPSVRLPAGSILTFEGSYMPIEDISLIGGTTGQSFTIKEA